MIASVGWIIKIGLQKWYFWCQEILGVKIFFPGILILKICMNEFQDHNEKLCSWSRNSLFQIGLNVVVRAFLKEKRGVSRKVGTSAGRARAPRTLTTKPALPEGVLMYVIWIYIGQGKSGFENEIFLVWRNFFHELWFQKWV